MLENEFFNKYKVITDNLINYGFFLDNDKYIYKKRFHNNFLAEITIYKGKLTGKVIDLDFDSEYTLFRVSDPGSFALDVKNSYNDILLDIRSKCFKEMPYRSSYANCVNDYIKKKYNSLPEFPWYDKSNKDSGIYRDKKTNKWFALIQYVDLNKLDANLSGKCEIINLKISSSKYNIKGIYPAYHMNHEKWISVILDGSVSLDLIYKLVDESYTNVIGKVIHTWLIPSTAGDGMWSLDDYFSNKYVTWNQSSNVHVGDTVYIYVSKPYSCIMYKCKIVNTFLPGFAHYKYSMELEVLKKYERGKYSLDLLRKYGVKAVRGPRSIPDELVNYIENK